MKKGFLLIVMALCCTLSMAQSIDRKRVHSDWNKLVVFCCASYEIHYLEDIESERNNEQVQDILNELNSIVNDSTQLEMSVIWNIISKPNLFVGNTIGNRMSAIYNHFDTINSSLPRKDDFELLFPKRVSDISFEPFALKLRSEVASKYEQSVQNQNVVFSKFSLFEIIGMVFILIFTIISIVLIRKICLLNSKVSNLDRKILQVENRVNSAKNTPNTLSKLTDITSLANKIDRIERAILDINNRIALLPKETKTVHQPKSNETTKFVEGNVKEDSDQETKVVASVKSSISLFLKNFNNGIMKECSKTDAQYELGLIDAHATTGEYIFIGDINSALATKDATFEDICELLNWSMSSKSCTTIEAGKAEKVIDGKWKVIKKAKVKFS